MPFHTSAVVALLVLSTPLNARSEPRDLAVTFSPFTLRYPIAEIAGEYRLLDSVGTALIVGVGQNEFGGDKKLLFWETGLQVVWYPLGGFNNGMQVGIEAMAESVSPNADRIRHYGFAIAPLVGYKLALPMGLTFAIQNGLARVRAYRHDSRSSRTVSKSSWQLLFNLNLGWSFAL